MHFSSAGATDSLVGVETAFASEGIRKGGESACQKIEIDYESFMQGEISKASAFTFVSLFSGAGIGDFGLKLAGGVCLAACELDDHRKNVHSTNIPAPIWGNIRDDKNQLIASLKDVQPDVLIATPPCQSFSTANARRGLRADPDHATKDARNHLFFEALHVAHAIKPKIILFENVPNFPEKKIRSDDGKLTGRVIDFIKASLTDYVGYSQIICFSTMGLPQRRRRSLAVFIRKDAFLNPSTVLNMLNPANPAWGVSCVNHPKSLMDAIGGLDPLDAKSEDLAISRNDEFHQVSVLNEMHYKWVSGIQPNSGKSAWENACQACGSVAAPFFSVDCVDCGVKITHRPHVVENGVPRSIKGFKTSYKRMVPDQLAVTVTTNSNSFSSDSKIHPYQNRVLSVREVGLLQAIPYSFVWPVEQQFKKKCLIREMIGEAVPPIITFQFGILISKILESTQLID
jgi:DNA (cytosine-5)-methyltransferase 1